MNAALKATAAVAWDRIISGWYGDQEEAFHSCATRIAAHFGITYDAAIDALESAENADATATATDRRLCADCL